MLIDVIIPAYNECSSIAKVLADIPQDLVREVVVVNNGSTDCTAEAAAGAGATLLTENRRGYGYACLKGIEHLSKKSSQPNVVVFLDGDYSDYPEELPQLVQPILDGKADMVIGSRALGRTEPGSMQPQQVFGNWLATRLMRTFYGYRYTDLGPFRTIRWQSLQQLKMQDKTYGWTVEMQLKAAKQKLQIAEVPVSYRKRIGTSKVSGTIRGTVMACYKIIGWILKHGG